MKFLLQELKPEDQESEEGKAILKELDFETSEISKVASFGFSANMAQVLITKQTNNRYDKYVDLLRRLNKILWEKGYFTNEFYEKFHDPSGGRKSGRG